MNGIAPDQRRANVIGLGLIGGSIALALRKRGWTVHGSDAAPDHVTRAVELEVIDAGGIDVGATITFVATPVGALAAAVADALERTTGLVTDVGSVKSPVASAVRDPRFIAGHPMAGSELIGLDGADADMFSGAVWVLTPQPDTPDETFTAVASIVAELGADVVAVPAAAHDALVAVVSHVPHLTAATLMTLADARAEDHAALLRLAAGGFRDMTRIASGHPAIWPDICAENRGAIVDTLDQLIEGLFRMRNLVEQGDRSGLTAALERARQARANLPARSVRPEELAEVRIPIPDRPGAAAEVFTLAAELGVNIDSFEVVHSAEGTSGVAVLLVDEARSELFRGGLLARRFKPSVRRLT
ncbi:MAG: prephenate dehydrogenase/arogenate dehydrogenase family protein [Acidimicrobiia bacterium]